MTYFTDHVYAAVALCAARDLHGRSTHGSAKQLPDQSIDPLDARAPSPGTLGANQGLNVRLAEQSRHFASAGSTYSSLLAGSPSGASA
jgi:hypothetical protein